jgi:hypothetical membrane protein
LSIQYFVAQVVAASEWKPPYSWRLNAISDLGATACGQFDGRFVCSPLRGLMNASLILLGLTMITGSALMYQRLRRSRTGFSLMATAGIGAILVGIFPALVALYLFLTHNRFFFGLGGMERIVAYPHTIWLVVFALYISRSRNRLAGEYAVSRS